MSQVRGVYEMECLSPEGFPILIAVTRDNRMACKPRVLYPFEDRARVTDEMWEALEAEDPEAMDAA